MMSFGVCACDEFLLFAVDGLSVVMSRARSIAREEGAMGSRTCKLDPTSPHLVQSQQTIALVSARLSFMPGYAYSPCNRA